jgi:hypothetical protein
MRDQTERHAWYAKGAKLEELSPAEQEKLRKELEAIGYADDDE